MAGSSPSSSTSTYNLMLGIFLKLLGFFVILYVYAEVDPIKAKQTERSIQERFNIAVSLSSDTKGPLSESSTMISEAAGRSLIAMDKALKAQFDFMSTRYNVDSNILILRLPAHIAMSVNNRLPQSPTFAKTFTNALYAQRNGQFNYDVELIVTGSDTTPLMKSISLLVQQMVAQSYPQELLTIGYQEKYLKTPELEIRITPVPIPVKVAQP